MSKNDSSIDCNRLRKALDKVLSPLGEPSKSLLIEELVSRGIKFDEPCSSIEEIEMALGQLLSADAAELLMRSLRKELQSA